MSNCMLILCLVIVMVLFVFVEILLSVDKMEFGIKGEIIIVCCIIWLDFDGG